jgi:hypothetical protein
LIENEIDLSTRPVTRRNLPHVVPIELTESGDRLRPGASLLPPLPLPQLDIIAGFFLKPALPDPVRLVYLEVARRSGGRRR